MCETCVRMFQFQDVPLKGCHWCLTCLHSCDPCLHDHLMSSISLVDARDDKCRAVWWVWDTRCLPDSFLTRCQPWTTYVTDVLMYKDVPEQGGAFHTPFWCDDPKQVTTSHAPTYCDDVVDVGNLCSIRCHRCGRYRQTIPRCSGLMNW